MSAARWVGAVAASVAVNLGLVGALGSAMPRAEAPEGPSEPDRVRVAAQPPPPPPPDPRPPSPDARDSTSAAPASVAPPVEASPLTGAMKGLPIPATDPDLLSWNQRGMLPSFVSGTGAGRQTERAMEVQDAELSFPPDLERYYPRRAKIDGIEGHTDVRLSVSARGRVEAVEVLNSEPPGVFDSAARAAAKQLRLRPARRRGRPQASTKVIRLNWTLPDKEP